MDIEQQTKKSSKLPVIITAVLGIVLAVVTAVVVRTIDGNMLMTGETQLKSLREELNSVSAELSSSQAKLEAVNKQLENQSKKIEPLKDIYNVSLAEGTYVVGRDLEPGIYHLVYKLKDPDDIWGDYLYVLFADSEGADKTLGGKKFDYRTEADSDGEEVAIKLDYGSTLTVESDYGLWKPADSISAE